MKKLTEKERLEKISSRGFAVFCTAIAVMLLTSAFALGQWVSGREQLADLVALIFICNSVAVAVAAIICEAPVPVEGEK